jgi:hypothetical protein
LQIAAAVAQEKLSISFSRLDCSRAGAVALPSWFQAIPTGITADSYDPTQDLWIAIEATGSVG